MADKGIVWTHIERHCAEKDMYDDGGYCDTKIPRLEAYFVIGCDEGSEVMCPECLLNAIFHQMKNGGKFPEYTDKWFEDFEVITKKPVVSTPDKREG